MSIFFRSNAWKKKKVNWEISYQNLFKLQNRIVEQIEKKNFRKVRHLQRLILRSISSRLIVSQKILELQHFEQFNLYKKNYKSNFLEIPSISSFIELDKSLSYNFNTKHQKHFVYLQFLSLLWLLAVIPIHETFTYSSFYNSRLYRNHTDVLNEVCQRLKTANFDWALILKPTGFFRSKNQNWLMKNALIEKKFLIYFTNFQKLANFSIKHYKYSQGIKGIKKISLIKILKNFSFYNNLPKRPSTDLTHVLYYNDLLIVLCTNLYHLKNLYKSLFLSFQNRGLFIKKNRIWIVNITKDKGFNFLGWSIKKKKNKIYLDISRENIKSHQLEIKKFLKSTRFVPIDSIITSLNKKIANWQAYYAYSPSIYKVWSEMNYYLFWRIWRWCKKRHKNKGSKWLYSRYWSYKKGQKWVFNFNNCYLKSYSLDQQTIIPLPASLNVCKIKNLTLVKNILFQKYPANKYNIY